MKPRVVRPVQALLVVGLLSACLHAQSVGIGTSSPHSSARLHISDNARGLLIPNVALTATNAHGPVSSPATSLLVYNTNTTTGATAVSPGFYYWDGGRWVRLLGGGEAWLLTGNAGTNPAVNFLGTTDNQPLVIQVYSQETFRFNPPGWSAPAWSIQRGGGDERGFHAVDLQSARSATTQVASGDYSVIGGGSRNTAIGYAATVCGGYQNTAYGDYSVVLGGSNNVANSEYNLVFGQGVDSWVDEQYRVYFFGPGGSSPSGSLVINRLDGDYPIHVGTNGTNGNGARLTTGGTWTNGSSRSFKERFVQYRPAEVLEKILQLTVEGYFYKGTEEYHITPMAEDFYRLFGTGVHEIIETDSTGRLVRRPNPDVDKYLAASDVAGVALLGIQALHEENAQLRQRVADLETENAALRARLERLETLMQRIASTQTNP